MLHSKHIELTKDKTEAQSTKEKFNANRGVISDVWITFPAGCAGLVKVRIFHEGHPFVPVEQDAYIQGDNFTFHYQPFFEIKAAPQVITIEAWNEDETYNHTIDVQLLIIDKKWIQPVGAYEGVIAALKSVFDRR